MEMPLEDYLGHWVGECHLQKAIKRVLHCLNGSGTKKEKSTIVGSTLLRSKLCGRWTYEHICNHLHEYDDFHAYRDNHRDYNIGLPGWVLEMIHSFADKETEKIWNGERSRKIPDDIQVRALNKLRFINRAQNVEDLRNPPSNRLHTLTDDRAGQYSVSINMQWRICFVWKDGNAENVEIVDYH